VLCVLTVAVCLGQLWAAGGAAAADLDIVAVVTAPAERQMQMVADVHSTEPPPVPSKSFSVSAGGLRLPTRAVPVLADTTGVAVIVDASAAGGAALRAGTSGAANLLLQLPAAARTAVVADTDPPSVVAPLAAGSAHAVSALSGVRAQGDRRTSDALSLALRQLSAVPAGQRLVVLYTSAPDAGGQDAADLAARLAQAHALLAVVTAGTDQRYWLRVTAASGGLLLEARPADVMATFDDLASALRLRYVVGFPRPPRLPAQVSLRVGTQDGTLHAEAIVSGNQTGGGAGAPLGDPGNDAGNSVRRRVGDTGLLGIVVIGLGVLAALIGAATLLSRRRQARVP